MTFEAKHFGTSTLRGRFDRKGRHGAADRAGKSGKAQIAIDIASVSTGVGPPDGHLKSKGFLRRRRQPERDLRRRQVRVRRRQGHRGGGRADHDGQNNPVTLKASNFNCYQNPMLKREVCGGDFETTIKRSQWGMAYGLPGIPDNIRLLIQIGRSSSKRRKPPAMKRALLAAAAAGAALAAGASR